MEDRPTQIASLIYFKQGVDKERILRWIKALEEKGVIDGSVTQEYCPEFGEPVWYIPWHFQKVNYYLSKKIMGKSYKERPDKFKGKYQAKKKNHHKKNWDKLSDENDRGELYATESWDR